MRVELLAQGKVYAREASLEPANERLDIELSVAVL
jgi:hypothetical protein